MPTIRQWIKAGIGFSFGVWIAAVVLFFPSIIVYSKMMTWLLDAMLVAMRHR